MTMWQFIASINDSYATMGYSIHSNTAALRQLAVAASRERAQLKAKEAEEIMALTEEDVDEMRKSAAS